MMIEDIEVSKCEASCCQGSIMQKNGEIKENIDDRVIEIDYDV